MPGKEEPEHKEMQGVLLSDGARINTTVIPKVLLELY